MWDAEATSLRGPGLHRFPLMWGGPGKSQTEPVQLREGHTSCGGSSDASEFLFGNEMPKFAGAFDMA
ncbi:hypothetical protein SAMN00790413_06490 [Deinococcus hopiensis KR-140]|uniref:Uncharacterized protein n=1 Tax=Deinococcus hopiensis KR-140 TaxID=695939 RepID=A0A1W1UAJ7_9DEIO|nr:hypothetical protein SAMN00790413_06490 [Deinococcus hopiensis KR-140]